MTNHEFGRTVGADTIPHWPVGTKSKGNEGRAARIMRTPGSVGDIDYDHTTSQKIPMAALENKTTPITESVWHA